MRLYFLAIGYFVAAILRLQAAPDAPAEFPFSYREGLLWLEVNLAQSEKPLNFLLDTGSGVSVIDLGTARRFGLRLGPEVAVHGVEATLPGHWQPGLSAKVGGISLPNEYLAVDLDKLSAACNRPIQGLVGADFFAGRVVQIDFDAQKVRLLKAVKIGKDNQTLALQPHAGGIRLPVSINGQKRQWVRLDTGCAGELHWVNPEIGTAHCACLTAVGLAQISVPQTNVSISLGGAKFENVPAGLHPTAIFPGEAGLLGNGILSRFSTVTIDVERSRIILGDLRRAH